MKLWVDKLSKSTAPITVFVISSVQSVIYWKNFCHVWRVSYGLYVINWLMRAVFWYTCIFSGYINWLCRHTVESYCVSWIYSRITCQLAVGQVWGKSTYLVHAPTNLWLTVLITSHKMSITLLIRFFLNITRWDFDYFGSNKYLYYILSIK